MPSSSGLMPSASQSPAFPSENDISPALSRHASISSSTSEPHWLSEYRMEVIAIIGIALFAVAMLTHSAIQEIQKNSPASPTSSHQLP